MKDIRNFCIAALVLLLGACRKNNINGLSGNITITPASGLSGMVVSITGKGFGTDTAAIKVSFNGTPAMIQDIWDTAMLVVVPDGTSGPVTITKGGQAVKGPTFTFQSLSITSITPTGGPSRIRDTITGTGLNFSGTTESELPAVYFNGKPAKVVSADSNRVIVIVPDTAGVGPVTVALGGQKATGPVFHYLGIVSVSPLTGNVGTLVTINGGFGPNYSSATVSINGMAASVTSATESKLVVSVPSGDTTGPITVQAGQTLTGPVFTFVPPPIVVSLLPASGPVGTKVTITGSNFSAVAGQNIVTFNGTPATLLSASGTQLVVAAPSGATNGPVVITVNGQATTAAVYKFQNLGITGIAPTAALPPCTVTISGFGFGTIAANDIVQINGTSLTITSIVDTQLVVSVPAGVTTGMVTVSTGGLSAAGPVFSTAGVVTIAGGTLNPGQFSSPSGLAIDASGNIFVADQGQNAIYKVTPGGVVTVFAGSPGNAGNTNGQGTNATFNGPTDLVFDKLGNLYVADDNNQVIRLITPAGSVSTFATNPNGNNFYGVAIDPMGNIYATDNSLGTNGYVYEFNSSGTQVNTINVDYNNPNGCCRTQLDGVTVDRTGNVWIIDGWAYALLESIYSGGSFQPAEIVSTNFSNRTGADMGICMDKNGNVIVADGGWNEIDVVNPQTFTTTMTVGGGGNGSTNAGYQDGPLAAALFNRPTGVKVDAHGNIYVADQGNAAIRKISLQ